MLQLYGISLFLNLPPVSSTHEGNKTKYFGNSFLFCGSEVGGRGICSDLFLACIQRFIRAALNQLSITHSAHCFPILSLYSVMSSCSVTGSLKLAMVVIFASWKSAKSINQASSSLKLVVKHLPPYDHLL